MNTYIGTFGVSHLRGQCYQPIKADTPEQAAAIMSDRHGYEWSTIYTLADYKRYQDRGFFRGHQPLPYIGGALQDADIAHQFFDRRYREILTGPSPYISKQERLQILQRDICSAYKDKPAERPNRLLQEIELQLC